MKAQLLNAAQPGRVHTDLPHPELRAESIYLLQSATSCSYLVTGVQLKCKVMNAFILVLSLLLPKGHVRIRAEAGGPKRKLKNCKELQEPGCTLTLLRAPQNGTCQQAARERECLSGAIWKVNIADDSVCRNTCPSFLEPFHHLLVGSTILHLHAWLEKSVAVVPAANPDFQCKRRKSLVHQFSSSWRRPILFMQEPCKERKPQKPK
eukprot:1160819-Pelagomonas_calceolata.AAC.3